MPRPGAAMSRKYFTTNVRSVTIPVEPLPFHS
jgi:hypothetical protein